MRKRLLLPLALALASVAFAYDVRAQDAPSAPAKPPPLQLTIDKSKVDLKVHRLELTASRDLVKVTIKVTGESGTVLADEARTVDQKAGAPLVVQWTPSSEETVVRIEVVGYAEDGAYYRVTITPWSFTIPHEEVNFRSGLYQIDESERAKLEASYAKINEALAKHPEIRVTLFLAGHTDTVGDAAYNLRLSRQRAQAIGGWFRKRGL